MAGWLDYWRIKLTQLPTKWKLKLKLSLVIENSGIFDRCVGTIGPIAEPEAPLHSNTYKLCKEELSENIYKLSSRTNYTVRLPEQGKKHLVRWGCSSITSLYSIEPPTPHMGFYRIF